MEIEYRIWLSQITTQCKQHKLAQQHLLLSRKKARMVGFKRFLPQINSLMLALNINENINEETVRIISDDVSRVDDGYLIRKKLGTGGFADVFLAHDMTNDRDVAIKCFHIENLMDHRQQQQIWNKARLEFEAVAAITHPSIAKIYAIGHDSSGNPYLVQEHISGGSLSKVMSHSSDLKTNLTNSLTYLLPIARALAAVHEAGVIHRDIKPENILINQQGSAMLVDFGIALLKQCSLCEHKIQGTEFYIAPEQMQSTDINFKADLFSFGCILYEWLSGNKVEIKQSTGNRISVWLGLSSSTNELKIDKTHCGSAYQLVSSLLEIEPENRPESASWVADEMQRILSLL